MEANSVLYIEPFYGGSHKQLMTLLQREVKGEIYSLPDTKWHWRMRVSALYYANEIPRQHSYKTLFTSSVLNLCELMSLRPDLSYGITKILYFHENQLVYPVRKQQDRDFQYGYNQILSCLVADDVIFNSCYNMESFLTGINSFMKIVPDFRPKGLPELIRPKCRVVYYPMDIPGQYMYQTKPTHLVAHIGNMEYKGENTNACSNIYDDKQISSSSSSRDDNSDRIGLIKRTTPLHIVWPHRWEHDKCPELLCSVMYKLTEANMNYKLSVLGSHTNDIPDCLQELSSRLSDHLINFGSINKKDYWEVLSKADVVLSTAKHEFYGVAMMEATCCGCYPLCPNSLVYPEIYPEQCLYNTEQQLFKKLKNLCDKPYLAKHYRNKMDIDFNKYKWDSLKKDYYELFH